MMGGKDHVVSLEPVTLNAISTVNALMGLVYALMGGMEDIVLFKVVNTLVHTTAPAF